MKPQDLDALLNELAKTPAGSAPLGTQRRVWQVVEARRSRVAAWTEFAAGWLAPFGLRQAALPAGVGAALILGLMLGLADAPKAVASTGGHEVRSLHLEAFSANAPGTPYAVLGRVR